MICSRCDKTIPEESLYCMYCGVHLAPENVEQSDDVDDDWGNRILCSDGNCTGTITDGKCTQCGLPV